MRTTHPHRGQLQLVVPVGLPSAPKAHSPIRPPRRYPLLDVGPVSGLANALRLRNVFPRPVAQ
jgi:hypothetical protein